MEQHVKTALKVMALEPGKERPTSYAGPASVKPEVTEEQVLAFADIMAELLPKDVTVSHVVKTVQSIISK